MGLDVAPTAKPSDLWQLRNDGEWARLRSSCEGFLASTTLSQVDAATIRSHLALCLVMIARSDNTENGLTERAAEEAHTVLRVWDRERSRHPDLEFASLTAQKVLALVSGPANQEEFFVATNHRAQAAVREFLGVCRDTLADCATVAQNDALLGRLRSPGAVFPAPTMSTTKTITGLAAFLLAEEGKVELDTPVSRYLTGRQLRLPISNQSPHEWFPNSLPQTAWNEGPRGAITVRNLLTHTSGLPGNNYFIGTQGARQYATDGSMDDHALSIPLINTPARRGGDGNVSFDYSNPGAQILAPVLANAAGEPLAAYVARRIFAPIGMTMSRMRVTAAGETAAAADMWSTPQCLHNLGRQILDLANGNSRALLTDAELRREYLGVVQDFYPSSPVRHCGHLLWHGQKWRGYMTRGFLNNDVYVLPSSSIVAVRMQAWPPPSSRYEANLDTVIAALSR